MYMKFFTDFIFGITKCDYLTKITILSLKNEICEKRPIYAVFLVIFT